LIFTGALTYNANYDALAYFLAEIFPLIRRQAPDTRLRVTGSTQGVDLDSLPLDGQVELTGYLADIRPAVAGSWACVVPLRLGGGTRLKILEAMSLGAPVISTAKGAEGLEVENGVHLLIAETPAEFAGHVVRLLRSPSLRQELAGNAARLVAEKYEWSGIGAGFRQAVERLVLTKNAPK
jgi:glycosyltransferase involved in cell wall biosynthesis